MNDKIARAAVVIIVSIIALGYAAIIWYVGNTGSSRRKYDERQEMERGRGYRYGFAAMVLFFIIDFLLVNIIGLDIFEGRIDVIIGVMIGFGVWCIYCINNEAFFAVNERPNVYRFLSFWVIWQFFKIDFFELSEIVSNGRLTLECGELVGFIFWAVIWLAVTMKKRELQREAE